MPPQIINVKQNGQVRNLINLSYLEEVNDAVLLQWVHIERRKSNAHYRFKV